MGLCTYASNASFAKRGGLMTDVSRENNVVLSCSRSLYCVMFTSLLLIVYIFSFQNFQILWFQLHNMISLSQQYRFWRSHYTYFQNLHKLITPLINEQTTFTMLALFFQCLRLGFRVHFIVIFHFPLPTFNWFSYL